MNFENFGINQNENNEEKPPLHYHGDAVRRLFLIGALIMAITLPFLSDLVLGDIHFSLFVIIVLGLVAGFIGPKQKWAITVNLLISLLAVAAFEYYAVITYQTFSVNSFFFWVNQILAINFLIALYYNAKTFRGIILNEEDE